MLLSLDEDCLRLIIELLELQDQMALANVCRHLKTIVIGVWKHDPKSVKITREQFEYIDEHRVDFLEYMHCISDRVEVLKLDRMKTQYFVDMKSMQFPKVRSLCVHTGFSEKNCDDNILVMKDIFPKVKSLELYGTFTGAHLSMLAQLEELNLDCCEDLRLEYFKDIYSKLHLKKLSILFYGYNTCFDERVNDITACKTLEEISIDDHHLIMIYEDLFKLKNLRKITCYTRDYITYLLERTVQKFGHVIETMLFDDCFWQEDQHCESVQKMSALRRLIFHSDDTSNEQLNAIGGALSKTLEEFYYLKGRWTNYVNYEGLLDILRQCTKLKVFDLSHTDIDVAFVERVVEILTYEDKKRKEPLIVRCYGTKITNEQLKSLTIPEELLQISFKCNELKLPGSRFFQMEFYR